MTEIVEVCKKCFKHLTEDMNYCPRCGKVTAVGLIKLI